MKEIERTKFYLFIFFICTLKSPEGMMDRAESIQHKQMDSKNINTRGKRADKSMLQKAIITLNPLHIRLLILLLQQPHIAQLQLSYFFFLNLVSFEAGQRNI